MRIERVFANPSADTFNVKPFRSIVRRYLGRCSVSVDPFARNKRWATYTNDLNPETAAEYHMTAIEFLKTLAGRGVRADLVIFDPPYTRRQVKECYEGIGLEFTNQDSQYFSLNWKYEREIVNEILNIGGYVLSFGYNSSGMQYSGAYSIEELLLVCHGGAHYDTICLVEKKIANQELLIPVFVPEKAML